MYNNNYEVPLNVFFILKSSISSDEALYKSNQLVCVGYSEIAHYTICWSRFQKLDTTWHHEDSHLDKYFLLLAILSGRNLCLHALGRMSSHHKCTMHIYWLKAQKYMWRGYEWTSKAGIGLTLQKHKKAASGGGVR